MKNKHTGSSFDDFIESNKILLKGGNMSSKVQKEYPDFVKEVQNESKEQLKARIVTMQQTLEESEAHKEENGDLKDARMVLAELSGPYRDVKKAVKLKTRYIIELLREKAS